MLIRSNRVIYSSIAAVCCALVVFALYLQHIHDLEPCPLCIVQRIAFIVTGIVALFGGLIGALSRSRWFAVFISVPLLAGIATAIRHVWIEHFPPKSLSCGGYGLAEMVDNLPLADLIPAIFRGTGDCGEVLWRFLGLSIAEWSLVSLVFLLALCMVALVNARTNKARTRTARSAG